MPSRGESRRKDHVAEQKGLLCQMDKKEAGVSGEDERAGCHIREDLESPRRESGLCSQGPLQFSKSMHGMVHIFSTCLATELQIGLSGSREPGGLGSGGRGGGEGKGECSSRNPSKSSWWLGRQAGQRSERKVRPERYAELTGICC